MNQPTSIHLILLIILVVYCWEYYYLTQTDTFTYTSKNNEVSFIPNSKDTSMFSSFLVSVNSPKNIEQATMIIHTTGSTIRIRNVYPPNLEGKMQFNLVYENKLIFLKETPKFFTLHLWYSNNLVKYTYTYKIY